MPSNAPKGKLHMTQLSKRLVGIVASTILLSLVSAAANAQGTWYTNRATWESLVTNIGIATYNGASETIDEYNNYVEGSVKTTGLGVVQSIGNGYLTTVIGGIVQFEYSGGPFQAFCGEFRTSSNGSVEFTVFDGGSATDTRTLATTAGADTFFGYISTSSSISDVWVEPVNSKYRLRVNSFNLGNRKTLDPGANVAPEPGSFALALTGGAALLGICYRRRRNAA